MHGNMSVKLTLPELLFTMETDHAAAFTVTSRLT